MGSLLGLRGRLAPERGRPEGASGRRPGTAGAPGSPIPGPDGRRGDPGAVRGVREPRAGPPAPRVPPRPGPPRPGPPRPGPPRPRRGLGQVRRGGRPRCPALSEGARCGARDARRRRGPGAARRDARAVRLGPREAPEPEAHHALAGADRHGRGAGAAAPGPGAGPGRSWEPRAADGASGAMALGSRDARGGPVAPEVETAVREMERLAARPSGWPTRRGGGRLRGGAGGRAAVAAGPRPLTGPRPGLKCARGGMAT